jgi:hypothetical protein
MPGQRNLYSEFADEQALIAQKERIIGYFTEVKQAILDLSKTGLKFNTTESVSAVAGLTEEFDKQEEVVTKHQQLLVKMAQTLKTLTSEEGKQVAQIKATTQLVSGLNTQEAKNIVLRQKSYEDLVKQKLANKELNDSISLRIKLRNAEQGSQEQLNLKYQKATKILNGLSAAQRDSVRGQSLQKFTNDLNTQLSAIEKKTGNFRRNVGNYAESLASGFASVRDEIAKLQQKQSQLQDLSKRDPIGFKFGGGDVELNKTTAALQQLEQVQAIGFKTNQSYASSVKQLEKEYQNLASSGNVSIEFLDEFKKFVAESKDQAQDLKDEIKALSSDTRGLDLLTGSISTIASGFEAATGAAALFGADTEDVQKSIQKLVAVQSVANGIREIGKDITNKATAAGKAYNAVLAVGNTLFGKGSTAAQRFGAAIKGIGFVLLITLIIQAVQFLGKFEDKAEDAKKRVEELNDELERNKKILQDLSSSDEFDFKNNLENLKQLTAQKLRLAKSDKEQREISKQGTKEEFDLELKFRKEQIEKLRIQQENANEDIIDEEFRINSFRRVLQELGIKEISKDRYEADKAALKAVKDQAEAVKSELTKQQRDLILFQKEFKTKSLEDDQDDLKKRLDAERRAQLELFKFRKQLIVDQKTFQSSDEGLIGGSFKINAAKEAAEAQKAIIKAQQKFDLETEGLTQSGRILINEKAAEEIYNINVDLTNKLVKLYVEDRNKFISEAERSAQEYKEIQDLRFDAEVERQLKQQEKQVNIFNKDRDERLKRANDSASAELAVAGISSEKRTEIERQLSEKKKLIEYEYQRSIIQSQILFYEQQVKLLKDAGLDTTEAEAQIANAKILFSNLVFDHTKEIADKEKEILDQTKQNYFDTFQQIGEIVTNVFAGLGEARKQQLQDQIDKSEELKAKEIERINQTGDSEEKKAAKIKLVESQAASRKEQIERRQRQIDRQNAIFQRGFKAFEITTDTIQGVNKIKLQLAAAPPPLKPLYISSLVLAIASGAAALTSVLAAPLPKFWTGTASAPGGLAHVAEKGRELGVEPSGKVKLWNKHMIDNVVKGTRIYPNEVTERIIASANAGIVSDDVKQIFINHGNDKGNEIVEELKTMNKRPPVIIRSQFGIETSAWFDLNMKH